VDFGSPETAKALEALFAERIGAEALKALKAELKAADEKARKEAAAKGKAGPAEAAAEDPGQAAKVLFDRLAAAEPVDDGALARLGDARAQAVIAELSGPGQIAAERLETKPAAALDPKDPVSAALNLEAGR
jgi:hypothetical protein